MAFSLFKITDISPNLKNIIVNGAVIAKQSPRLFHTDKDEFKCVFNFTLRDSEIDSINISCWGSLDFVQKIYKRFAIGHYVQIKNPQIIFPSFGNFNFINSFQPHVSSPLHMNINEDFSDVNRIENDKLNTEILLKQINKSSFHNLCEIIQSSNYMEGKFINLLIAIREIKPIRVIKSKKIAKNIIKREIKIFDSTCDCFSLILWDDDTVNLTNSWIPQNTILFAADVKVQFDRYNDRLIASTTTKTIITIDPNIEEADYLRNYAQSIDIDNLQSSIDTYVNENRKIYTIKEILKAMNSMEIIHGIVYAYLTNFDLDGQLIPIRCCRCRQWISKELICYNCWNTSSYDIEFSIKISLSDETGTLEQCYLPSNVVETMLGLKPNDFIQLDTHSKTDFKWQFLLEQFKIYFKITSSSSHKNYFNVIKCVKAANDEMVAKYFTK